MPVPPPDPDVEGDRETSRDLSFPRPEPKLVVPITSPSAAHPFFSRPGPSPVPGPAPFSDGASSRDRVLPTFTREILPPARAVHDPSSARSTVRPRPRPRWTDFLIANARTLEVLGFVIAWILTVGAAAVVVGHVLARSEMPAVVWLSSGAPAAPSDATCSPPGQPPEVAVDSLPPATTCEAPRAGASPAPARTSPARRAAVYPMRRVPAPSEPKTLGDWMRDAVR
ncbi:MAG TPA: hypothetical protein VK841_05585 [Polyangiaceae bacterium]|jgi:hypothetical protein|nr:hypothetical protein [Polyangiaceae bacterium]